MRILRLAPAGRLTDWKTRADMGQADAPMSVRVADRADAEWIGRLLHQFNEEYDDPSPGPEVLAGRIKQLIASGETAVLLTGDPPQGLAVLRFRASIWDEGLECYLAELFVVPEARGEGLGRALLESAIDLARARGAVFMDLNTSEADATARRLYESLGFSNREGKSGRPVNYYYERKL